MRGSGLAQKMMELIIQTAAQQGYLSMSADILKTNTPMIKLLKNQDLPSRNRTPKKPVPRISEPCGRQNNRKNK